MVTLLHSVEVVSNIQIFLAKSSSGNLLKKWSKPFRQKRVLTVNLSKIKTKLPLPLVKTND